MIKKFLNYHTKKITRYFSENTRSRVLVATLMLFAVGFLAFGIFYLTRRGLISTQEGEDLFMMKATPLYIYQLFFLITGFLIFVSSSIFGLLNFFKSENDDWIMASPKYQDLSWIKLVRAIIDSSWPVIILALPLLLAVHSVFSFSVEIFLISLMSVFLFAVFVSSLAIVMVFIFSFLLNLLKVANFRVLAGLMGSFCIALGFLVWSRVVSADIMKIFQVEEVIDPNLSFLRDNFAIFPSYFPAMTIYYGQVENLFGALIKLTILANLLAITIVFFTMLKSQFLKIWQTFQEGLFEAKAERKQKKSKIISSGVPKSAEKTIFKKELLVALRAPQNFFWFSFLMILMFAQVGVVNLLERYAGIGSSQEVAVAGITPSLQIGVILFFASALILRFVFPSFSQESNTAWILGAAPINLREIFKVKYNFFSILLVLASLTALSVYVIPLSVNFEIALISAIFVMSGVLTLTMLGLSLGTIFINFKTDDPQRLSTSGSGIGFILTSLIYSGFGAYLLYQTFAQENYIFILFFFLISLVIYIATKQAAINSLKKIEFL